ncbi:MAG: TlyA family RNA methyltransferase [Deltaproteobacteria bacterium]|nr:TlyA family RNA methyltransferase [Deltaproteobacteria bacterium]
MAKERADVLLVLRGQAPSRSRAQAMIMAGAVVDQDGRRIDKPGMLLADAVELRIKGAPQKYVSRGGLKLEAALQTFGVEVQDRVCLDVGASTGGFTDCLLQRGARKVYAVDVGYGQMAWALRQDPRVVLKERCNIRTAPDDLIAEPADVLVVDVSFISLKLVLPKALQYLTADAWVVALVKPQFEAGRDAIGKGGIVRDPAAHARVVREIEALFASLGLHRVQVCPSPITGADGNREFLMAGQQGGAA